MKHLTVLCFLVIFNSTAHAGWTSIGGDEVGEMFIDKGKVIKKGKSVMIWQLINYKKQQKLAHLQYRSNITLIEYDCKNSQSNIVKSSFHSGLSGAGDVVASRSFSNKEWEYVTPNSYADATMSFACTR